MSWLFGSGVRVRSNGVGYLKEDLLSTGKFTQAVV